MPDSVRTAGTSSEATGPFGSRVAERQGYGPVADLMEDDRRDQDAEIDDLAAGDPVGGDDQDDQDGRDGCDDHGLTADLDPPPTRAGPR